MDSCVYVISAENGLYKIGVADNLKRRLATLRGASPVALTVTTVFRVNDPYGLERELHERYAGRRKHGEWFALTAPDVAGLCNTVPADESTPKRRSNGRDLLALARAQGGYFNSRQAAEVGYTEQHLYYHIGRGLLERHALGVYRHTFVDHHPHNDLWLVYVWSYEQGIISHESALDFYGVCDVMPSRVAVTVPRGFRRNPLGRVEQYRMRVPEEDVRVFDGLPITGIERTIIDSTASGTQPDQIERAVRTALDRGLTTPAAILDRVARPGYRNKRYTERLLAELVRR